MTFRRYIPENSGVSYPASNVEMEAVTLVFQKHGMRVVECRDDVNMQAYLLENLDIQGVRRNWSRDYPIALKIAQMED
jgi:hypothetical protein